MTASPTSVLIVDDEEDICLLLRLRLTAEGFGVVGIAHDGAEAIRLYRELSPDVVVMDLLMPNVSGFEAIATIKAEFPQSKIVAHSGVAGDFVREAMDDAGTPVVLKSGDLTALIQTMRSL